MKMSPSSPEKYLGSSHVQLTRSGKERRLGIHGARGTGKTCYLACLYGHRSSEKAAVTFGNNQSIDHLNAAWKALSCGNVPAATALALPTELSLNLNADGLAWDIPTRDYAGALVQRSETGVPVLKKEVKEWLAGCHGILLFVNCDADDAALKDRHDELDLLITELKRLSPDGNTISRPIALLLTKWDVRGAVSNNVAKERQRVLEYLKSRPALEQIANSVKNCGDRVEIFPVSAFGSNIGNSKPPKNGPQPCGLVDPLVWIVQKTDEMLLERARRDAQRCAGEQLWWWQRRYGKAVAYFRNLEKAHGINKGPTHERVRGELSTWQSKLDRRRILQAAMVVAIVSIAAAGRLSWEEQVARERALAALNDASMSPEDVQQACEDYRTSSNPLAKETETRDEIARALASFQKSREEKDFTALERFRMSHSADENAESRCEQCRSYLARWPGSERTAVVKGWETDDSRRAEDHKADLKFEREYHLLQATLQNSGDNFDKAIAACNAFLGQFPEAKYPKRKGQRKEIEQILASNKTAKDDKAWAVVANYERQNPSNFDEIIRIANVYLDTPGAAHRKSARELIDRTEVRWDRAEYEKMRSAAREAKDADSILATERAVKRYINGTQPRKMGLEEAKKWLKWFDGLAEEKDYHFTVKSVLFPKDTELSNGREAKIYGSVNGAEFNVPGNNGWGPPGDNPQFDEKVGPVRFKWGDPGSLNVTVQRAYGWNWLYKVNPVADYRAVGEIECPSFILGKLNGSFVVKYKDIEVTVELECPEAVPPTLKPYPER